MNPNLKDIAGKKVGRWRVLSYAGKERWNCVCDCGTRREVTAHALNRASSKSCGCLQKDTTAMRCTKHGLSGRPEYAIWEAIKQRCLNPNSRSFKNYGGRGITLCPRWETSFEAFISDMGFRPSDAHTIERRDNSLGYEPSNCFWGTRKQQNTNKRDNRPLTLGATTQTISQWSRDTGIHYETIRGRLARGWTVERALSEPPRQRRR